MTSDEEITKFSKWGLIRTGSTVSDKARQSLENGEITPHELRSQRIAAFKRALEITNRHRWIDHLLNRLAFESEMLGGVSRFEGEITATLLQTFARGHGADKPKASKTQAGNFELKSLAPLPKQFVNGASCDTLELTNSEWAELMSDVCYCGRVINYHTDEYSKQQKTADTNYLSKNRVTYWPQCRLSRQLFF